MRSAVLPLLLLCGCVQIAGIEDTSGDGLIGLTLGVERVSIGATVERSPQSLAANTATYLLVDDLEPGGFGRVSAEEAETGLWVAEIFDATPPVLFDLPEPIDPQFQRLWNFPNQDLLAALDVLEHPDPTPLADPATQMLTVMTSIPAFVLGETFELFVVGTWNQIGLTAPLTAGVVQVGPQTFAASTMAKLTGRPHEQITTADVPIVIRRTGNQLTGVLELTSFDQTGNDMLTGTLAAVPADQTLSIQFDQVAAMGRLAAARPAVTTPTFSWELRAAPGRDLGNNTGPLLHAAAPLMADTMATAMYANPFVGTRGWGTVLTWVVNATRTTTPPGQALPVTLSGTMIQLVADPEAGLVLDFPAGRVEAIAMDGTSLSSDGMTVSQPTAPVVVTMTTDRTNDTLFGLDLFELVPNAAGTALEFRRVLNALSLTKEFTIPPEVFEVGKIYTIRCTALLGLYPEIATGDLQTRELPMAAAGLDSGVFQVTP